MPMRELRYEHKGANAYLIYTVGAEDTIDSLSLGMLTNNEIEGIIPTQFSQMDDTKQIMFNVSGKVSAAQLLKTPINKKRLVGILSGVVVALLSAEEYMLEPQSILLGLDYIYVDMKTAEASVVCLPLLDLPSSNQNLKGFIKDIVYQAQFDQSEGYDHIAQILNYVNGSADLSLDSFRTILANLSGAPKPAPKPVPAGTGTAGTGSGSMGTAGTGTAGMGTAGMGHAGGVSGGYSGGRPKGTDGGYPTPIESGAVQGGTGTGAGAEPEISLYELLSKFNPERLEKYKEQQKKKKQEKQKGKEEPKAKKKNDAGADFGLDFPVPGYGELIPQQAPVEEPQHVAAEQMTVQVEPVDTGKTELVVKPAITDEQPKAYLIRMKNDEQIMITGSSFVIGKKRGEVDYCITENNTVSRIHAIISYHSGEYFVTDLESTNCTYVNGSKIPAKEEVILAHGTRLSFSDEEYEFRFV